MISFLPTRLAVMATLAVSSLRTTSTVHSHGVVILLQELEN